VKKSRKQVEWELLWYRHLEFTVPGAPIPKKRAKVGKIRFGPMAGRAIARTPQDTVIYENKIAFFAQQAKIAAGIGEILDCPVRLSVLIYVLRPASAPARQLVPDVKPDYDNILKSLGDGAEGVVWKNDSRIVAGTWEKRYGDPRLEVLVERGEIGPMIQLAV
jgi:Holliday junction resolvase RusA-like endonuclease